MILLLSDVPGVTSQDLLARPDKAGNPGVRGPVADMDAPSPLAALGPGAKLHIVGNADFNPEKLVSCLEALGFSASTRLRQIHLIADCTEQGGAESFATRLAAALEKAGLEVDEIKAPRGPARCDDRGKIWVCMGGEWAPSSPALNVYAGPRVELKHQQPARGN